MWMSILRQNLVPSLSCLARMKMTCGYSNEGRRLTRMMGQIGACQLHRQLGLGDDTTGDQ